MKRKYAYTFILLVFVFGLCGIVKVYSAERENTSAVMAQSYEREYIKNPSADVEIIEDDSFDKYTDDTDFINNSGWKINYPDAPDAPLIESAENKSWPEHITGNVLHYKRSSAPFALSYPVEPGIDKNKLILEVDYLYKNASGIQRTLVLSQNTGATRAAFFQGGAAFKISSSVIAKSNPDTWYHIQLILDMDKKMVDTFVSGVFKDESDVTTKSVTGIPFQESLSQVLLLMTSADSASDYYLDNFKLYTVDDRMNYIIKNIEYENMNYPSANETISGVNIIKQRDTAGNASLFTAIYDENGYLQLLYSEMIDNDMDKDTINTVKFENAVIPETFSPGWTIKTFILEEETLKPLATSYKYIDDIAVTSPSEREIFQRNNDNIGSVKIKGNISGNILSVEAKITKSSEDSTGENVDWTEIPIIDAENFEGSIPVMVGGWYNIDIRAKLSDGEYLYKNIEKVGVGDIYITTGQSNSINYGGAKTKVNYDTISTWNPNDNTWQIANDPQVTFLTNPSPGSGGSPWPSMANYIEPIAGVPIGIVACEIGSQPVSSFVPGTGAGYRQLKYALERFEGEDGVKAILFHQGESDVGNGTSYEEYKSSILSAITGSREIAGWDVPWVIAQVSYVVDQTKYEQYGSGIIQAQKDVCDGINIFQGPTTDDLLGDYRHTDGIHLSAKGLAEHGKRWGKILEELFYLDTVQE